MATYLWNVYIEIEQISYYSDRLILKKVHDLLGKPSYVFVVLFTSVAGKFVNVKRSLT